LSTATYAAVTTRQLANGSIKVRDGNGRASVLAASLVDHNLGLREQHRQALAAHFGNNPLCAIDRYVAGYTDAIGDNTPGNPARWTLVWVMP